MTTTKNLERTTSVPAPASRRRIINRPHGTFAHFLDALISYDFAYFQPTELGFTAYKNDLAVRLSIKPRQLSRILSGQVLPEARLLKRLSEIFPHIRPEGWIPRLSWTCVDREMELLPDGSVISLFVGHLTPAAVDSLDRAVLEKIATEIDSRNFKYVYFLAPLSARLKVYELSPTQLADRLRLRILLAWLHADPQRKRSLDIEKRIAQRLLVFETNTSEEAGHFWSLLPRYLAASNLLAEPGSEFSKHRFSVALDGGSVPYHAKRIDHHKHVPVPVSTGGWSYMEPDYDDDFRRMFIKMEEVGLFVDSEHKVRRVPRPIRTTPEV